jgi:hypothetical protein
MTSNKQAGSETESLEPTPSEIRLVPSLFAGRTGTVFFDYPEGLGIGSRCDAGCVTEQLGQRSLTFKTHWERNSVKNAFSRVRHVQYTDAESVVVASYSRAIPLSLVATDSSCGDSS